MSWTAQCRRLIEWHIYTLMKCFDETSCDDVIVLKIDTLESSSYATSGQCANKILAEYNKFDTSGFTKPSQPIIASNYQPEIMNPVPAILMKVALWLLAQAADKA